MNSCFYPPVDASFAPPAIVSDTFHLLRNWLDADSYRFGAIVVCN